MTHDGEHERLLERILVGELDEHSPEAGTVLAGCRDCRVELARLRALDERLETVGRDQQRDLELARRSTTREDAERVAAWVRGGIASRDRINPWRRNLLVAAAAVLLLLLGWAAFGKSEERDGYRGDVFLGGELWIAFDATLHEFRWEWEGDATFEVVVRTVVEGAGGEILIETKVTEPRWKPAPEILASLPDKVCVEVTADDARSGAALLSLR